MLAILIPIPSTRTFLLAQVNHDLGPEWPRTALGSKVSAYSRVRVLKFEVYVHAQVKQMIQRVVQI